MKYLKDQKGVALVLAVVLAALVLVVAGLAISNIMKAKKSPAATASPKLASSSSPIPSSSSTPTPAPTSYNIPDLGLSFMLADSLSDLRYQVVHLEGDQAVNSVEFSSARLESAGCNLASAPLGYLTYDSDKGGTKVAYARNSDLYYLPPKAGCKADASLQDWKTLETSLKTLVMGPGR